MTETVGEEGGVQVRGAAATATLKTEQARPNDKLSQLHKTLHSAVKKMSHKPEDAQAGRARTKTRKRMALLQRMSARSALVSFSRRLVPGSSLGVWRQGGPSGRPFA